MSPENPLWGAPRIHGELSKLGFDVAQSTVAKYMAERRLRLSRRIDGPTFLTMYRFARHWRGVVHLRGGPELWGRFLS